MLKFRSWGLGIWGDWMWGPKEFYKFSMRRSNSFCGEGLGATWSNQADFRFRHINLPPTSETSGEHLGVNWGLLTTFFSHSSHSHNGNWYKHYTTSVVSFNALSPWWALASPTSTPGVLGNILILILTHPNSTQHPLVNIVPQTNVNFTPIWGIWIQQNCSKYSRILNFCVFVILKTQAITKF